MQMMYLALTYDHRILDGREAVTFLVKVKVRALLFRATGLKLTTNQGVHRRSEKDAARWHQPHISVPALLVVGSVWARLDATDVDVDE